MNGPNRRARHRLALQRQPGRDSVSAAEPAQAGLTRPKLHVHIDTLSLHDIAGGGTAYAEAVRSALTTALSAPPRFNTSDPETTARTIADAVRTQIRTPRV
jgi:hypothetical protein